MEKVSLDLYKPDVRTPWGFRIQGGRDFNRPLIISRITCQSVSDIQGLKSGDQLLMINSVPSNYMLHQEAQEAIIESGTKLKLDVLREANNHAIASRPVLPDPNSRNRSTGNSNPRRGVVKDIQMSHSTYDLKHRSPICQMCKMEIRGPFIIMLDSCFCPGHCICCCCEVDLTTTNFIEVDGKFYCESDYAKYIAPDCHKCNNPVIENEVTAMNKKWHHECFTCNHCAMPLATTLFKVGDDGFPYCEHDWNDLFQIKCSKCNLSILFTDQFVEVNSNFFHVKCFCCSACKTSLEGKQFHSRNGKPFCKTHAFAGVLF